MKTVRGKFEIKSAPANTDDNIKKMGGMAMTIEIVEGQHWYNFEYGV